jgi:tetratricopeptide (TPR) repeat protein
VTGALLNQKVDGLIAAGRYREALALPQSQPPARPDTQSELLVQINLAEAEYNLGLWEEAWQRLRPLDPLACIFPITRAGLAQQRAWIAAHFGRAQEALHHWERAELRDLPRPYHAEHFFTGVVVLLALGDLDAADGCARAASHVAMRPSSRRNAFFVRARVAEAQGDYERAEQLCRAGAQHSYKAAGGDGLLLWGDLLRALHREEEAREAYSLAVRRDAESESARIAAARLHES